MSAIRPRKWVPLALTLAMAAGCQQSQTHLAHQRPAPTEPMPTLGKDQHADIHVALGRSLEKQGDLEQAAQAYGRALAKNPLRAEAYARLAVIADKQGRFTDSAPLHRRAIALDKNNADLYCNAGYSLYLQQNWEFAAQCLNEAIQLKPDHARAHNNLGLVFARSGRHQEAFAEFRAAGCSEADAHTNLAHGLTLAGAFPLAQHHYQLALNHDPQSSIAARGLETLKQLSSRAAAAPDLNLNNTPTTFQASAVIWPAN